MAWNRIILTEWHGASQSIDTFGFLWKPGYRERLIIYFDFITLIQIWVRNITGSYRLWACDAEWSRWINFLQNLISACSLITFGFVYFLKSLNLTPNLSFLWVLAWALVRFFHCFLWGLGEIRNFDGIFGLRTQNHPTATLSAGMLGLLGWYTMQKTALHLRLFLNWFLWKRRYFDQTIRCFARCSNHRFRWWFGREGRQ